MELSQSIPLNSFKLQFRAWWDGVPHRRQPTPDEDKGEPENEQALAGASEDKHEVPPGKQRPPNLLKGQVAQEIWGEGCLGPNDGDYVAGLVKPLNPNSESTILVLSAELGGSTRLIAEKFGTWISAFESLPLINALGLDQGALVGDDRKVDIKLQDFETLELPERKFAGALWKEGLFRVADKAKILQSIYDSLRPGSSLVITDIVTPTQGEPSVEVQDWARGEPVTPTLWSKDEVLDALTALKFKVPINEDISEDYQRAVIDVWKRWMVQLPQLRAEGGLDAKFQSAMMDELAYWVHRANLIETGDLKIYRYFCLKPEDSLASLE